MTFSGLHGVITPILHYTGSLQVCSFRSVNGVFGDCFLKVRIERVSVATVSIFVNKTNDL
jgi:hypothetical protein